MEFGCCAPIDRAEAVKAAGFDYLEAAVTSLIPDQDDATFSSILAQYQASPIPVKAFNLFLPRDLKVTGPEIDEERIRQYVGRALARVQQIGAGIIVFGSGGARNIPDGFPRDEAENQLVHFLNIVADAAEQTDVTLAIEPLNTRESNIINSVAEGAEIAARVNRPSIQVLADFYHMDEEDEPLSNISAYKNQLAHVHVADTNRHAPGSGQYPYPEFVAQLRQANYDALVSIECRWNDFETEAAPAVDFLRRVFA